MAVVKPPVGYHAIKVPNPAADADYMREHANLQNQQNQFNYQQQHAAQQYNTTYGQQQQALGYNTAANKGAGAWNPTDLTPGTYGAAQRDVNNDFVSRGMGYSTPYATASSNMLHDYQHREAALATARNQFTQTAGDQATQYKTSNQFADQTALRSAIARIAGQYGIQPGQVKPGSSPTINVKNP